MTQPHWKAADALDARLRATLDTVHDAVVVIDEDGVIIDVNRALERTLGYRADEAIGRNVRMLMPEPYSSEHDGYLARHRQTGETRVIGRGREVEARRADGTTVPIELAVNPFEVDGRRYFCGTLRDLSAQKSAERERAEALSVIAQQHARLEALLAERTRRLNTSEQFCRSALDALSAHIAILDDSLCIVEVNRAWREFGIRNGLALGVADIGSSYSAALERAVAAGDRDAQTVLDGLGDLVRGQRDRLDHVYPCHSSDEQRWFVLRATRFSCARGTFVATAHENITQQHLDHDALVRSEALFRGVIETGPDYVFITTEDERVEFASRTPVGPGHHIVGGSLAALMTPHNLGLARAAQARALATGEVVTYESVGAGRLAKVGQIFSIRVGPFQPPGTAPRLIWFATDVTERRRAEAELLESQENLRHAQKMDAIGRLAGGIAHDFNNLLTAVRYHAAFAREGLLPGDPLLREIEHIDQAAERATALTRQLLAYGRRQTLQPEVVEPRELIAELIPMLQRLVGPRLRIELAPAAGFDRVEIDRGQFQQVITNLVVNARDAIETTGTVTIATARAPSDGASDWVVITVRDDGAGMPEDVLLRVFEPFFTTKGPGKGTGLGLATVYGIVSQSQGTITVESEVGCGTVFEIRLPRVVREPRATRPKTLTPARGSRRGEVILLVEDDLVLRHGTERVLREAGYGVIVAADAADALRTALDPTAHIDLLVSDIVMPDTSGPELAARVRTLRPGLPTLLISGYAAETIRSEDLAQVFFLAKPFAPAELLRHVHVVLGSRRPPPSDDAGG